MADRIRDLLASITSSVDELKTEVDRVLPSEPQSTNVVRVKPGDDLAAAILSLKDGGTVLGQPGDYSMNLEPQVRESRAFVLVKTDTTNLPSEGKRIGRDFLPGLMRLKSANNLDGVVKVNRSKAGGLAFSGVAFMPQQFDRTQIELGWGAVNPDEVPQDYLFDRCLFIGDTEKGQHRGIQANCANLIVRGCSFHDMFEHGRDSQAICGWNGSRNHHIENCFIESGAENVMYGGAKSASAEMNPRDIKMIGCLLTKNRAWMNLALQPSIKALFEIKAVIGFHMAGCVLDGNWRRDWASGVSMTLKIAPSGAAPWTTMEDVLIEDCIIRNVGKFLDVVGWNDGNHATGSERAKRVKVRNIFLENVNTAPFLGDGRGISLYTIPHWLEIDHITNAGPTVLSRSTFLNISAGDPDPTIPHRAKAVGFKFTNSLLDGGAYGLHSSKALGKPALDLYCEPDYVFTGNAIRKGERPGVPLPAGNHTIDAAAFDASFDGRNINPGSAIASVPTTDGKLPGADVNAILQRLADPV